MTISDEAVAAFVDGELSVEEAARIDRACTDDADLRHRIARYRMLRAEIDQSFSGIIREPVPSRLRALFDTKSSASDKRRAKRSAPGWRRVAAWRMPTSIAAALAIGFFVAGIFDPNGINDVQLAADGAYSAGLINAMLENNMSGAQEGDIQIVASYLDENGKPCREIIVGQSTLAHALACREPDGSWPVLALAPAPPPGAYVTADGEGYRFGAINVELVELSEAEEKALLAKGWRSQ